jgi:hypothetical protein
LTFAGGINANLATLRSSGNGAIGTAPTNCSVRLIHKLGHLDIYSWRSRPQRFGGRRQTRLDNAKPWAGSSSPAWKLTLCDPLAAALRGFFHHLAGGHCNASWGLLIITLAHRRIDFGQLRPLLPARSPEAAANSTNRRQLPGPHFRIDLRTLGRSRLPEAASFRHVGLSRRTTHPLQPKELRQ